MSEIFTIPEFETPDERTAHINSLALQVRGHAQNAHDISQTNPDLAAEEARRAGELFDPLMRLTSPRIGRVAVRFTGPRQDAADLTQQIYFRAFRFISKFEGESSFETWLYQIALNTSSSYMQKRTKQIKHELSADLNEDLHPIQADELTYLNEQEAAQTKVAISAAIATLSEAQRVVIEDYYMQGSSIRDIARKLGIKEGAVRVRLHRARKVLSGLLGSYAQRHLIKDEADELDSDIE